MKHKHNPSVLSGDALPALETWGVHPDLKFGDLTLDILKASRADVAAADDAVEAKRAELKQLIGIRDDKAAVLNDQISRVRSGIRASFGPDSPEYKKVGGIRRSDRKGRSRGLKLAAEATVAPAEPVPQAAAA